MAQDEQDAPASTFNDDSSSTELDERRCTTAVNERDAPVAISGDDFRPGVSDSLPKGSRTSGHVHAHNVGWVFGGATKGPRTEKTSSETDSASEPPTPDDPQHLKAWARAHYLHRKGFIQLVREDRREWSGCEAERLAYDYRVSIAEMQRMYMRALQMQLADRAVLLQTTPAIWFSGDRAVLSEGSATGTGADLRTAHSKETIRRVQRSLGPLLKEYTQAVRDYKYMGEIQQEPFDYFIITPERDNDRNVVTTVLDDMSKELTDLFHPTGGPGLRSVQEAKDNAIVTGEWEYEENPEPLGGTRNASARNVLRRGRRERLMAAVVGATFLIGPMWLLVLKRDLYTHLGSVTGFVLAFGLLMVWQVNSIQNVFASTLAYAAVLMVFVGVSLDKLFP